MGSVIAGWKRFGCWAAAVGLLVGLVSVPAWAAAGAHITASPSSVMVNGATTLTGTGFTPHSRVTLRECGAVIWVVPQRFCDSGNAVTLKTSATGSFQVRFTVELCPHGARQGTSQTCYIGQPTPRGVDTLRLKGAVKITVTYP